MTIWYVDPTNGTDANASAGNGDSFATRRKSVNNIIAAALTPGDTVRIMGSPAPTSLSITGTWTNSGGIADVGHSISATTNATPIVCTSSAAHGMSTGAVVSLYNFTVNTNAIGIWNITVIDSTHFSLQNADGTNSVGNGTDGGAYKQITNCTVKLASALTKTVALTGNRGAKPNWTATTNVTTANFTTDNKEGESCQQIAINATFTTGLAAYYPLGSAVDFSAYQQISFWLKQTAGTVGAAGALTLNLCSDVAGATVVNSFNIPSPLALNAWMPVTVNFGSALGSSIQSVGFNVVTDNGAQTFLLDNIQACKSAASADSLTLQSLIGKNISTDTFFPIQSINNGRVIMDNRINARPSNASVSLKPYYGVSETVTAYKRETTKVTVAVNGVYYDALWQPPKAGTDGNLITYSGGWNTTDMSTQTLETWLDGLNGFGYCFYINQAFIAISNIALVRHNIGINIASGGNVVDVNILTVACTGDTGVASYAKQSSVTAKFLYHNYSAAIYSTVEGVFNVDYIYGCNSFGFQCSGIATIKFVEINDVTYGVVGAYTKGLIVGSAIKNCAEALEITGVCTVRDVSMAASCNYGIVTNVNATTHIDAINITNSAPNPVFMGSTANDNLVGVFVNSAGVVTNTVVAGTINSEASVRHTASGIAWKLSPTAASPQVTSARPMYLPIAKIACASGSLVTASVWMRRTNTALTARLMCKAYQIAGVTSDVSTAMTAAVDTWEQIIITFTPTEVGVVELLAECWGGTTYSLYVDDFTVSQV